MRRLRKLQRRLMLFALQMLQFKHTLRISYNQMREEEKLAQSEAAKKMGISQSQYQRDLWEVHVKLTEALASGKAIRICSANTENIK